MVKHINAATVQLIVQWQGGFPVEAIWEFADDLLLCFPGFSLEDKEIGERVLLWRRKIRTATVLTQNNQKSSQKVKNIQTSPFVSLNKRNNIN